MKLDKAALTAFGSTSLFVLLWSGGGIAAELGLTQASAFAFLVLRFALGFAGLLAVGLVRGQVLPPAGTRLQVASTGALLVGLYSISYLLALDEGVAPGVLATILGVQPILTLLLVERRFSAARLSGLGLALAGLVAIVYQNLAEAHSSSAGIGFALVALGCMTVGAILQKRIRAAPAVVLPLQYGVSLILCLGCLAFEPFRVEWNWSFALPLGYMGLVISVGATLLFYRLIQAGNLVNVTSLFYLVPAGTAALDYLLLGHPMAPLALGGMAAILGGLALVFRTS